MSFQEPFDEIQQDAMDEVNEQLEGIDTEEIVGGLFDKVKGWLGIE